MFTTVLTIPELKQLFIQTVLNHTGAVTKISDESVLGGVAFGDAKIAQKALNEISLVEQHLFPDGAFDTNLDNVADFLGIAPRFGASASSTYILVTGTPGTIYTTANTFTGNDGIQFKPMETYTIPSNGYMYFKVNSQTTGLKTNVKSLSIATVSPIPSGHSYCINEYQATGGRDAEQDDIFRKRIKDGVNLAATGTLAKLTQVFMKVNPNVLRCFSLGFNQTGQVTIAILTQNGVSLTTNELTDLIAQSNEYLSMTEAQDFITMQGVELRNIVFDDVVIDFRVELYPGYNVTDIRENIQKQMTKLADFRFWNTTSKLEWDNLLQVAKQATGVKYVPDEYFSPNHDQSFAYGHLPRIASFIMRDIYGNIIETETLNPIYYPNSINQSFQSTILTTIAAI
jgi:hypothetical protein